MKQLFQLVGGEADGTYGEMSILGDNQPNAIETHLGGPLYTYASAKEETRDGERVNVRFYRLAHIVSLEDCPGAF